MRSIVLVSLWQLHHCIESMTLSNPSLISFIGLGQNKFSSCISTFNVYISRISMMESLSYSAFILRQRNHPDFLKLKITVKHELQLPLLSQMVENIVGDLLISLYVWYLTKQHVGVRFRNIYSSGAVPTEFKLSHHLNMQKTYIYT